MESDLERIWWPRDLQYRQPLPFRPNCTDLRQSAAQRRQILSKWGCHPHPKRFVRISANSHCVFFPPTLCTARSLGVPGCSSEIP